MYWYYKVLFGLVAVAFVALIGWSLRGFLPDLPADDGDRDGMEHVDVVPTPPPLAVAPASQPAASSGAVEPGSSGQSRPAAGSSSGVATRRPAATASNDPDIVSLRQTLDQAQGQLTANNPVAARAIVEELLQQGTYERFSEPWIQAAELLGKINAEIMLSDVPAPEKVTYTVERGDSVWRIAKKLNVTMPMVMQGNSIDPSDPKVFPGQTLKIYKGDWNVLVSKSHYLMQLRDSDRLVKIYHVGIGRQDRTPIGQFRITTKERDPIWHFRGKQYPFGHPENVLGTRWMGLEPVGDTNALLEGYGIHGTNDPTSIGGSESNGCIRMLNEQVEELFEIVPYHTPVIITD